MYLIIPLITMMNAIICFARLRHPFAALVFVFTFSSLIHANVTVVDNLGHPIDNPVVLPIVGFAKTNAFTPTVNTPLHSVTVNLNAFNGTSSTAKVSLWSDGESGPLSILETLGTVDFSSSTAANYTLISTKNTQLASGIRYWIVVENVKGDFDWNATFNLGSSSPVEGIILNEFAESINGGVSWNAIITGSYPMFKVEGSGDGGGSVNPVVINTNDTGPGSLRQAISDVSSGGIITFDESLSGEPIVLLSGTLALLNSMTIDASALALPIVINGNGGPVIEIAQNSAVTLDALHIMNGAAPQGGGIFNAGALTLINSTISGNVATNEGGGIFSSDTGTLTVTNSTIVDNAASDGGGIRSGGAAEVTITNSTISGNAATSDGGGIWNNGSGTVTITNSTISGNAAGNEGGGLWKSGTGTVTITNSTISNNAAPNGGGLWTGTGALTVTQSTLSGNSAQSQGGGLWKNSGGAITITNSTISSNSAGEGGGVFSFKVLTLNNSIVAGNHAALEPDLAGVVNVGDNNLIGVQPYLTPLGNYGGSTETMVPIPGSPAIDTGGPTVQVHDQRGLPRVFNDTPDIGSVEYTRGHDLPRLWVQDTDGDGSPFGLETTNLNRDPNVASSDEADVIQITVDPVTQGPVITIHIRDDAALHTVWYIRRSNSLDPESFTELFRYDGPSETDFNQDPTNFSLEIQAIGGGKQITLKKFTPVTLPEIFRLSSEYVEPVEPG